MGCPLTNATKLHNHVTYRKSPWISSAGAPTRALLASLGMTRRDLFALAAGAATPFLSAPEPAPSVKLGIDLFSLRSQNWTPFQYLDYSSKLGAKVVHFSEIRFIGNLEPENLRAVRRYAEERGIEIE